MDDPADDPLRALPCNPRNILESNKDDDDEVLDGNEDGEDEVEVMEQPAESAEAELS